MKLRFYSSPLPIPLNLIRHYFFILDDNTQQVRYEVFNPWRKTTPHPNDKQFRLSTIFQALLDYQNIIHYQNQRPSSHPIGRAHYTPSLT